MVSEGTVVKDKEKKSGYVLVVALATTIAVGVIATGLVGLTLQERRLAARSSAYSKALFAAESGVDLACEEFSKQSGGASAWSGWASSGSSKSSSSNLAGGSQYSVTALNSADLCTITATGQVSVAGVTVQRTVRVKVQKIKNTPFKYGITSGGKMVLSGNGFFNSFDSTDSAKSTNGQYDPAKAGANATVASLTSQNPAFSGSGNGKIKGDLSVSPGEQISTSGNFTVTGSKTYDASQTVSDVTVPFSLPVGAAISVGGNNTQTITVSGSQNMSVQRIDISGNGAITIRGSGTLRMYVDQTVGVSGNGEMKITPNPTTADLKVEIYADGNVTLSGNGVVNDTLLAANFSIWGTPNCSDIQVSGNGDFIGTIYAPQADIDLSGNAGLTGAALGNALTCTGNGNFHIDESLIGTGSSSGSGKKYKLLEWVEL